MLNFGLIILAAGGSTRMGQPKQLLDINGQTLIRKTISTALTAGADPCLVVLGNALEKIKSEISGLNVEIAQNPDWKKGMASSLRIAIESFRKKTNPPKSVMILLCDQPLITSDYLKKLFLVFQESTQHAIASEYNDIKGVPAIFDFETLAQFSAEQGDFGARHLIKKLDKENQLAVMSFPEGAIDLDTPEDYERFLERNID